MLQKMFEHFVKFNLNLTLHHSDCQLDPIAKIRQVLQKVANLIASILQIYFQPIQSFQLRMFVHLKRQRVAR